MLRMELKIDKQILKRADRCGKGFRCLEGILCEAEVQLIGAKRFICHNSEPCTYKFSFGKSFFCTCPVRQAIYDKYGK